MNRTTTSECPYCHRRVRPGERIIFATNCRLEGLDADSYSVAYDVRSKNQVVHLACWEQMLVGRPAPVPIVPDKAKHVEMNECASVERTDALGFLE